MYKYNVTRDLKVCMYLVEIGFGRSLVYEVNITRYM